MELGGRYGMEVSIVDLLETEQVGGWWRLLVVDGSWWWLVVISVLFPSE